MSFVEHFDGGSIPASFGSYATGFASHSVADSRLTATWSSSANPSASSIYYNTPLDLTKRQRWAVCKRTDQNFPNVQIRVIANTGAPSTPDTRANLDAKTLLRLNDFNYSGRKGQLAYRNTSGNYVRWDDATKTFTTSDLPSIPDKVNDDYDIMGFEYDPNFGSPRWRMFWIHVAFGTSITEVAGPKLFALTDWVASSAMEDGAASEIYVMFGWMENDFGLTGAYDIEWVAMDDGEFLEGVANQKSSSGGNYELKPWSKLGVDGSIVLPHSRTGLAITRSGQAWHSASTQFKSVVRGSNGTLYMFYNGASVAGQNNIGIAYGPTVDALTDYASNPIISRTPGGNLDSFNILSAVEDFTEPDASKRWKLFASAFGADGKYRVYLYTASEATGPVTSSWTNQGIFLDATGDDAAEGGSMHIHPKYVNGRWYLFYNSGLGATTKVMWATADRLEVGQLVKRGFLFDGVSGDEMTPTAWTASSRTVTGTVPASFTKDMLVVYDVDSNGDNFGLSRIRKVNAGSIEMYHYIPGGSTSGRIRGFDAGAISVHDVWYYAGEWWFDISLYHVFTTHGTYSSFCEVGGIMRAPTLVGPFTIDWFRTPQCRWGRDNNQRSSENISWAFGPVYGQTLDPDADITDGAWLRQDASSILFSGILYTPHEDMTYIYASGVVAEQSETRLSDGLWPTSGDIILYVNAQSQ